MRGCALHNRLSDFVGELREHETHRFHDHGGTVAFDRRSQFMASDDGPCRRLGKVQTNLSQQLDRTSVGPLETLNLELYHDVRRSRYRPRRGVDGAVR